MSFRMRLLSLRLANLASRLLPKSLYGRLVLALFGGLIVAQLLSAAINFAERDQLLFRARGMQSAQHIADVVELLDSSSEPERSRIVAILSVPPQRVTLVREPAPLPAAQVEAPMVAVFSAVLHGALGAQRPIRVALGVSDAAAPPEFIAERHRLMMQRHFPEAGPHGFPSYFLIQVQLRDGMWVNFDTRLPDESANVPWRLFLNLAVLLIAVLLLAIVAVRWLIRPLAVLARAADDLGRDINRPPLPETGPLEVVRAAHAFNTMQERLVRFIAERTRILAAMSHDLKTPITRMRLRADLLDDEDVRLRFEKDLIEMETMVAQTLDFMRGLGAREPMQQVDVMALLESLQADYAEMDRKVEIEGRAAAPASGMPQLLKRCIANLLDNAVLYGKVAKVKVEDDAAQLVIKIRDEGPGLSPAQLERVFEPFYRVEASRSRETGGTGLGLAIARDIAQAHGGEVKLANHPQGGLEAVLTLPRVAA